MEAERMVRSLEPAGGWLTPGRFVMLLAVALFAAFPLVMLGVHSFFFRDYGVLGYPFVAHHHESFWQGEWPLWNPYSNCGAPFLAQWGTMTLYPPALFYLLFPLPWSLSYFCLGHLLLGGAGMFFLARRWVDSPLAAGVAGLAFVFSGATFSCLLWPNYAVALGWMPWVVLLAERSWREGGRTVVLAALVGALQLLSGVPELVLFTWLLLGCLAVAEWSRAGEGRRRLVLRFGLVVAIVAGLCAAQLLPFQELLELSQRDRHFATSKWAMPSWGWANLFVPLFHCFKTFQGPYLQGGQEFISSYYPGVGVLILALTALGRRKEPRVWILSGLVVVSLLMAAGENGFLFPILKGILPVVGVARYPIKFVLLAAFALPLLAAFGLQRLEASATSGGRPWRWLGVNGLAAAGAIALVVWLAAQHPYQSDRWSVADNLRASQLEWDAVWPNALARAGFLAAIGGALVMAFRAGRARTRALAQLGLMALLVADVLTHTPTQNPTLPVDVFARQLRSTEATPAWPRLGEGRVLISPGAESRLLFSESTNSLQDVLGKRLALWSNLNLLDVVPKVNGSSTLQLREQAEVQRLIYGTNRVGRGLLDFLSVSHFSPAQNPTAWLPRDGFCPLVTAGQQPVFARSEEILAALPEESFDPRKTVFLDPGVRPGISVTNVTQARVLSAHHAAQKIVVEVEADEPSLLVVAQSFHPAWRAAVDGRSVPLWRANHAFQCLEIPAGRHQVTLVYRDKFFLAGGLISVMTLLGCGFFWVNLRRRPPSAGAFRRTGEGHASAEALIGDPDESKVSF